ncbi:hypothetical protein GGP94_003166 [Salinibacter ruber]|uniref:hypothetical protein n=1 Tax=Salinibacter ruber TaxID=146919 RepID=UPI0021680984|nr:hypothetical protein [Salinibacter ruber]MCS4162718.1 hypothetical protein [Salinibacter ruber]
MAYFLQGKRLMKYLSDEAREAGRTEVRIEKAEAYVITRYRAERETALTFDFDATEGDVLLEGWKELDDGTPAPDQMPDVLVDRLAMVTADVVEYRLKEEKRQGLQSVSQGGRSKSFENTVDLPTRLFMPLERFDQREGVTGWW